MKVIWSRNALRDLESIHDYVSEDAPQRADRLISKILEAAEQLTSFPHSGRTVPEFADPTIREILSNQYRVIYCLGDGVVEIITILHGSRILPNELLH